jgi:hypothetical protein
MHGLKLYAISIVVKILFLCHGSGWYININLPSLPIHVVFLESLGHLICVKI